MREILFRGKRKNGEWVQGYYILWNGKHCIYDEVIYYEVLPETIGQYTGLTDKNGEKIFEGDIVRGSIGTFVVKFLNGTFCGSLVEDAYLTDVCSINNHCEVIGNIHDNPELLKEREGK